MIHFPVTKPTLTNVKYHKLTGNGFILQSHSQPLNFSKLRSAMSV